MRSVHVATALAAGLLASVGLRVGLAADAADPDPADDAVAILTAIDVAPNAGLYGDVIGNDVRAQLLAASQPGAAVDGGLRLRALRGLGLYPGAAAVARVRIELDDGADLLDGVAVLHLGAAVEALGYIGDASDQPRLITMLEFEACRDVRELAARALQRLNMVGAVDALRERFVREPTQQVQLAISEALRALEAL